MSLEKQIEEAINTVDSKLKKHIEPISVLRTVREIEDFWCPPKVRRIIFAESHVYSSCQEWNDLSVSCECRMGAETVVNSILKKHTLMSGAKKRCFPSNYVRFILGLAYGSSRCINISTEIAPDHKQTIFWKVLACAAGESELDFKSSDMALEIKLAVLEKLMDRGYWLLQASNFGLYVPPCIPEWPVAKRQEARIPSHPFASYERKLVKISRQCIAKRLTDLKDNGRLSLERVFLLGAKARYAWYGGHSPLVETINDKVGTCSFPHPNSWRPPWNDQTWSSWYQANKSDEEGCRKGVSKKSSNQTGQNE